jgi:protein Tex
MPQPAPDHAKDIATALTLSERGVRAVLSLFAESATVPFIARYRKEATGGLDEVQLRAIQAEQKQRQELWQRREAILESIDKQGKLSDELRRQLEQCSTKAALEDLYLPFKPRRRTRAQAARERGLEPLARLIQRQPREGSPKQAARSFVAPEREVPDVDAALQGARDILAEEFSERADIRAHCREIWRKHAVVRSKAVKKATSGPTKFEQYYDFSEPVSSVPAHRTLAMRRGESEGVLRVAVVLSESEQLIERITKMVGTDARSAFARELREALGEGYDRLLSSALDSEFSEELALRAERSAIQVFAENLKNLLLAAPLGGEPVIGIDPGFRTGCKCAAVDHTGKLLEYTTLYATGSANQVAEARRLLVELVRRHSPKAIAIGNGTGGRETFSFVRDTLRELDSPVPEVVSVNEAGASVYSASDVAREEFPDLDLTIRGAISIARRLQDPLAELVKIDPQAIGVGQYQHDVAEANLRGELAHVVEGCVNHVGVDLNTASAALLSHVAGLGPALARNIVLYRQAHGAFKKRAELQKVPRLGPKAFEQAAGFLRIPNGEHPLDASAVHPERYGVVGRMAKDLGVALGTLVGNSAHCARLDLSRYVDPTSDLGLPTLEDIRRELEKPGRDPRAHFAPPAFRDDVRELTDLKAGMQLEGVVTNVTAFGAFVDVGVHQDGLVHVSELAKRFVKDPGELVKVGDRLGVTVLQVDLARKRIALRAEPKLG